MNHHINHHHPNLIKIINHPNHPVIIIESSPCGRNLNSLLVHDPLPEGREVMLAARRAGARPGHLLALLAVLQSFVIANSFIVARPFLGQPMGCALFGSEAEARRRSALAISSARKSTWTAQLKFYQAKDMQVRRPYPFVSTLPKTSRVSIGMPWLFLWRARCRPACVPRLSPGGRDITDVDAACNSSDQLAAAPSKGKFR